MDPPPVEPVEPQVFFRAGKKKKTYRQHGEPTKSDEPSSGSVTGVNEESKVSPPDDHDPDAVEAKEDELSVSEVLRLRNARKSRLRGVEFRSEQAPRNGASTGDEGKSIVLRGEESEKAKSPEMTVADMAKRFAPQTGLVGELVNKHMEQYIELELAKRHSAESAAQSFQVHTSEGQGAPILEDAAGKQAVEQPAMQGKLQEIDLGEEARIRNVAMTDRARRRLEGEELGEDEGNFRRKKARLGRDGKPWRPRKRRASDDIKRDQLVEEILRENRLDVYDVSQAQPPSAAAGDDVAADERIAEEFRREFMDAMTQRQQRKRPVQPPSRGPKKEDEAVLKGPKLGGSRNVRAAMRDLLLKEQEKKK